MTAVPRREAGGEERGGAQGVGDLLELGRSQTPSPPRTLERAANVARPANGHLGLFVEQAGRFLGLLLEQLDMPRVADGQRRLGQLA